MALQINIPLTTHSGLAVASGAYCWLQEERAKDNKYSVRVDLVFFRDKAAYDEGRTRFYPVELPDSKFSYYQLFTPANYANLTSTTIHNFIKAELEAVFGPGTVSIVV